MTDVQTYGPLYVTFGTIAGCVCYCVDGVSAQPLHSHRASAQNPSIHLPTDTAAGRPVRIRLCTDSLPQDGFSSPTSRHAANTVTIYLVVDRYIATLLRWKT